MKNSLKLAILLIVALLVIIYLHKEMKAQDRDPQPVEKVTGNPIKREKSNMNRLQDEKSPYLLQHAANPVDWYPWGQEAFEKARREDKPIFLSIGYSTCHWCHVMEHESFEDSLVASLMNDAFISIKVDREERPDIDHIYMSVCQMITGQGGWPLTIIMTPDKKPFFAATYIPKENRFGRPGLVDIIPQIKTAWQNKREEILNSADQITAYLQQGSTDPASDQSGSISIDILDRTYSRLNSNFDTVYGGFGSAPKFPTAHKFLFLLRYWQRTKNEKALNMVEQTLQVMRNGGIYDHIGFGFHRYSTDKRWLVPHFEKMLYDQAMLVMAYTETYLATGKKEYEKTARQILTYVLRDMTSAEGGFYSAEDADSEGREGLFYLWSIEEINRIFDKESADLMIKVFNLSENGNYHEEASPGQTGLNIFHLNRSGPELALELNMTTAELSDRLEKARQKLFELRENRIHPYKDDKILTDWNGLMIAALAKAARAFDDPAYLDAAKKAAAFVLKKLRAENGRLIHRYREGQAGLPAHIDDYAFFCWGLLELYQASFDTNYLITALELNKILLQHFWDDKNGAFYFTADDGENLIVRKKEFYDGAIPSGNSVAMLNMLRLGRLTANPELERKADKIAESYASSLNQTPDSFTQFMAGLDFALGPAYEVVIAGDPQAEDTKTMFKALGLEFIPNKVVLLRPTNSDSPTVIELAEYTKTQTSIDGKATAYVCQNYACNYPTTDINKMLSLLGVETDAEKKSE